MEIEEVRVGDTEDIKAGYRGGCGADSYGSEVFIPDNIPDSAYLLEDGEEVGFPENPKEAIPSNQELRNTSMEQIYKELENALSSFTEKARQEEYLEEIMEETGESKDMILDDLELVEKMADKNYYKGLMQMGDTNLEKYMDDWNPALGYDEKAVPLGKGVNINPGHNMAAVVIPEVWRALSKNSVLHKMPGDDQVTMRIMDEVYQEMDGPLADSFKTGYWPGGSEELEKNLFSEDYVMAWGSDSTIEAIKEEVAPTTRFIPFHFEFGSYLVDEEFQENYNIDDLYKIAEDFSWGDQLLCFSPLMMAVEESENTEKFMEDLADVLEEYKEEYEMGKIPDNEKMKKTRAKRMARDYDQLVSDFENDTVVVMEDDLDKDDVNEFHSFRFVEGHKVEDLSEAIDVLGSSENLQEFILATSDRKAEELRDKIAYTKANRIASPGGAAPSAPITWDGKHPLNEMVKWVTDERNGKIGFTDKVRFMIKRAL
ncbi:MAG: hypothetical protein MUP58_00660 [Candidatus Nanohaloarchaeota archaeon QJJ-9]|nr:hypothetical protein [Candidatus Nanohaloarchaeota archaeon QJJ-9]